MLQWMLHATLVALMAGLAAVAWERAASLRRSPSRWAWVAALAVSAFIPLTHALAPLTVSEQLLEVAASPTPSFDAAPSAVLSVQLPLIQSAWTPKIDQWLGIAWLCASAIAATIFALGLRAVRREQKLGSVCVIAGHRVVITESLGPAVIGLTNPTILLPGWIRLMSARQREVVIAHELQHVHAKDQWLIGAAICVLIVFPWNVVLWWQLKRLRLAIELDCDQRVLRNQFEPNEYGQVLIDAASLGVHHTTVAPALIESTSSLEKRIRTMLRSRASYDKPLIAILAFTSFAICASAATLKPPSTRPWTPLSAGAIDGAPRVLSPQHEFEEQWDSLVQVIEYFEPSALNAGQSRTPFVFIAADDDGRIIAHHLEFRSSWQDNPIADDELQGMFVEYLGQPTNSTFMALQLKSARFGPSPAMVMLGVRPSAAPIDVAAPAIDMPAIRRDPDWLQAFLIRKTENQRAILNLADAAAIDTGLPKGTELWIALSADGEFVQGGRRKVMTDPNESKRFVEKALPAAHVAYTSRGTAVRDARGARVAVAWHWLSR